MYEYEVEMKLVQQRDPLLEVIQPVDQRREHGQWNAAMTPSFLGVGHNPREVEEVAVRGGGGIARLFVEGGVFHLSVLISRPGQR